MFKFKSQHHCWVFYP